MNKNESPAGVERLATGIPGFDIISKGGLPRNRTTLVSGTAGSGKTTFAAQFLARGIEVFDQAGVFVTFEESPEDIRANMAGFGWDIAAWEAAGKWTFVDASSHLEKESLVIHGYNVGSLIEELGQAIRAINARRVVIDSMIVKMIKFAQTTEVRTEFINIGAALNAKGVTVIITGERSREEGRITKLGIGEYAAHNVIVLSNLREGRHRRRTIEIVKFRGVDHKRGETPYTIQPGMGIVILPLSSDNVPELAAGERIDTGIDELNQMCGGGFFTQSNILVSGPEGVGKTLLASQFLLKGANHGHRGLYVSFEESREKLAEYLEGWRIDLPELEEQGLIRIVSHEPEAASLEEHLLRMMEAVEEFKPQRLVIDCLSVLARVATEQGFNEFLILFASWLRRQELAALVVTKTTLTGERTAIDRQLTQFIDTDIQMRYVESMGQLLRGLMVLKMHGSTHDDRFREFNIDDLGLHIGQPINVKGFLTGNPRYVFQDKAY